VRVEGRLTSSDFNHLYKYFEYTAFRLETLREYVVPEEQESYSRFQHGQATDVMDVPGYQEWLGWIRVAKRAGKTIERVRILDEPPTSYQRWAAWIGHHNEAAGEVMRYISRSRALQIGLPLSRGDWWLLDSVRVASVEFDECGVPMGGVIHDRPDEVQSYISWRNLALRHSRPVSEFDSFWTE
jgi:hypothetical protein